MLTNIITNSLKPQKRCSTVSLSATVFLAALFLFKIFFERIAVVVNLEMNLNTFARIIFLTLFSIAENCYGLTDIIRDLLRNNVAGPAINFQTVSWPIDPDAGLRRRTEYEALNGKYGYKHVERLGLGEDGRTEERRRQQRLRDEVGALAYTPPLKTGY